MVLVLFTAPLKIVFVLHGSMALGVEIVFQIGRRNAGVIIIGAVISPFNYFAKLLLIWRFISEYDNGIVLIATNFTTTKSIGHSDGV